MQTIFNFYSVPWILATWILYFLNTDNWDLYSRVSSCWAGCSGHSFEAPVPQVTISTPWCRHIPFYRCITIFSFTRWFKLLWFHKWNPHTFASRKYGRKAGIRNVSWIWESLPDRKSRSKYDLGILWEVDDCLADGFHTCFPWAQVRRALWSFWCQRLSQFFSAQSTGLE